MAMEKAPVRIVGFDMDGTLIDTAAQFPVIFGEAANSHFGIPKDRAEAYFLANQGTFTHLQIHGLLASSGVKPLPEAASLLPLGISIDQRLAAVEGPPFDDVVPVLEALNAEKYEMFVSSSHTTEAITRKLTAVGLIEYFPFLIGKDPGNPALVKGEPHFRAAAAHFKRPYPDFVSRLAYVGDAPSDITSALDAGARAIGRSGSRTAEALRAVGLSRGVAINVVDNFTNLPALLRRV